jgi:hypothetical protein
MFSVVNTALTRFSKEALAAARPCRTRMFTFYFIDSFGEELQYCYVKPKNGFLQVFRSIGMFAEI